MGMPWVKLYVDLLDDTKLGFISEGAQLLFVKLILLAGDCDAEGYLVNGASPLTLSEIAWRLRVPIDTLRDRMAELEQAELVGHDEGEGIFWVVNFQKRQGRSQSEKRALWRERKRRQKEPTENTAESRGNHAGITPLEGEREGEREGEAEQNKSPSAPSCIKVDFSVFGMSDNQVSELKRIRKKNKGGSISQRVANAMSKEFHQAAEFGYSFDDLLTEWESRGWKSFKAEWVKSKTVSTGYQSTNEKNAARMAEVRNLEIARNF